jgi:uncharacterized membrane protein
MLELAFAFICIVLFIMLLRQNYYIVYFAIFQFFLAQLQIWLHGETNLPGFLILNAVIIYCVLRNRSIKKRSANSGDAAIEYPFSLKSKIFSVVPILLYIIFFVSFVLHIRFVNAFISGLAPSFFDRFFFKAFEYSSQLNSTYLMLLSNLSGLFLVLILFRSKMITKEVSETAQPGKWTFKSAKTCLGLFTAIAFTNYFIFAFARHMSFNSKAWDLAIFAQLISNFSKGVFFEANVRGVANIFSDHFSPIIYVFSPFLYLWNDPSTILLIFQSAFLAIGAMPIYLITRLKSGSQYAALAVAFIYLLLPPIHFLSIADFHPITLSIPLLLFAWYFWEVKRYPMMYLFTGLALMCQEEVWIMVGAMGLFLLLFERDRVRGSILAIAGWGGFLCLVFLFFPLFREGEGYFYVHRYAYLGNSVGEILSNFFLKPWLWIPRLFSARAIVFLLLLLLPVGLIPLKKPKYLLILLPAYIYSTLSVEPLQTSIFAQYVAVYIPFIMIGTIYGLHQLANKLAPDDSLKRNVFRSLAILSLAPALISNCLFSPFFWSTAYQKSQIGEFLPVFKPGIEKLYEQAKNLPSGESISCGSNLAPHLIRRNLYLFPDYEKANYILLDMTANHSPEFENAFHNLINTPGYLVKYNESPFLIFQRVDGEESSISETHGIMDLTLKKPSEFLKYSSPIRILLPDSISTRSPVVINSGGINENAFHDEYYFDFEKVHDADTRYFGVIMFPSNSFFINTHPEFQVVHFYAGVISTVNWVKGESYRFSMFSGSEAIFNRRSAVCIILPIPENYPNTLEEYVIEMAIKNRWNASDPSSITDSQVFVQRIKW